MIRHIVMWDLRGETEAEKADTARYVQQQFEGLRDKIPGLVEIEVGIDESGVDYACDVVLLTVFETAEALAAYATHPAHLAVRENLGTMRVARHQVDYTMAAASAP